MWQIERKLLKIPKFKNLEIDNEQTKNQNRVKFEDIIFCEKGNQQELITEISLIFRRLLKYVYSAFLLVNSLAF